jgi:prepilin-type N-terminal cleavage/methylation domain-containing protein
MLHSKGFSLMELLVVVTIVSILVAVAAPAYNRYLVKARVMELLTTGNTYKVKLIDNILGADSSANSVYTLDTPYIDRVSVHTLDTDPVKHVIQIVAKMKTAKQSGIGLKQPANTAKPLMLQLQGISIGELVIWECHTAAEYNEYVPGTCKNNNLEALSEN